MLWSLLILVPLARTTLLLTNHQVWKFYLCETLEMYLSHGVVWVSSQADLVAHGLEQGWGVEKLAGELAQYARKRQTN